ncbi:hypothetical protein C3747_113g79 [Trypanosoma cruzi]|uniref:RanBP2-type domain-containing protein n=2 Tax=Trypanosoma cruzi TaxID=5693 RepID=Q4DQG7_TRYCC|nr:hypothetical protein, conserved [Trypanosoma cruzi]EAN94783.1 hypothetical protein, conserved [Trypanosoma cruzi]PWV06598.1 hypothetical protein C3747_113g79 [Trypanosoma cruzi]|eukprot:XP_816634.1 hypothetical protein [Trypanosoma cruzi strain CL Brener]
MDFLKRTFADTRLRYHVSKVLFAASTSSAKLSTECLLLAEQHPTLVLAVLRENLQPGSHQSYAYLLLLEKIVDACSFSFHAAMALDCTLHDKLVKLATTRAEGEENRKVRRLARLTLLEYSRMFVDVPELKSLSRLAGCVEKITGRSLMRSIEVESKKVTFVDPRPEDIILISPTEVPAKASLPPSRKPAVWSCHVCTYINRPHATVCVVCRTPKATRPTSPPVHKAINGKTVPAAEILNGTVCHEERSGDEKTATSPDRNGFFAPAPLQKGEGSGTTGNTLVGIVAPHPRA